VNSSFRSCKIYTSKVAVLRKLGLVGKDFAIKSRVGVDLENVNCNRKRKTPSSVNIEEMVMKRKTTSRPFAQTNCLIKDVTSPFGLLEELFSDNPWNLLLSTILLNRTSRVQVDVVLNEFLAKWPSPESVAAADWEEISLVIRPLGIRHRRAKGLIRFSRDYLTKIKACSAATMTREDILSLHHCGDYAYDAYRIFIQRNVSTLCADHALQDYVEYQRGALLERTRNVVKRSTNPIPSRSRKSL
jgi:endonuclease III